jgi:hypothetical protein
MKPKRMPKKSAYTKRVLALIDEYEATTGDKSGDLIKTAAWLLNNGKFDPPAPDPVKAIAKRLASASRQDYIADENGEPVRRRHVYSHKVSGQRCFEWFKIEEATPDKMRMSVQHRRTGTLLDILQLVRDVDYYNKNFNPGDPIPVDPNFDPDIVELRLPRDYSDSPPDEERDDDDLSGDPVKS